MKTLTLIEEPERESEGGGAGGDTEEALDDAEEEFERILRESGE